MTMRKQIVEGDALKTGGIVLPTGATQTLNGFPVAYIGSMVTCFVCGVTGPIIKAGGGRRWEVAGGEVEILFGLGSYTKSEEVAMEDDEVVCACPKHPQLLSVLSPTVVYDDEMSALAYGGRVVYTAGSDLIGGVWSLAKGSVSLAVDAVKYDAYLVASPFSDSARSNVSELNKKYEERWDTVKKIPGAIADKAVDVWNNPSQLTQAENVGHILGALAPGVGVAGKVGKLGDLGEMGELGELTTTTSRAIRGTEEIPKSPVLREGEPIKPCSCFSITFASGEEKIHHLDFALQGAYPFALQRTYNSSFHAYDNGVLGARWTSEYTTKLRPIGAGYIYYSRDGRRVEFPLIQVGQTFRDDIELIEIARTPSNQLILTHNKKRIETYDLAYSDQGDYYRLAKISLKNQGETVLKYEHYANGLEALSDIIAQPDTPFEQHIQTILNTDGRITELQLRKDKQYVRTLAHYTYDEAGDLVRAIDEHGQTYTYQYDHHLVTRYTDRNGMGVNLEYDGTAHNSRAIHEWSDDQTMESWLSWDDEHNIISVSTGDKDHVTRYHNDPEGYSYLVTYPDGREERVKRDAQKHAIEHTRPDGTVEHRRYAGDNLIGITHPDGSKVQFGYDNRDNLTGIIDPLGNIWQGIYDEHDRIISQIDPLGHSTRYEYNAQNQLVRTINANQGESTLSYNDQGLLIEHIDCSGKRTSWTYDADNRLIAKSNALGETVAYEYADSTEYLGRLSAMTRPDGTRETIQLNGEGRISEHTDALERSTRFEYGIQNKVLSRTDANGHQLAYHYDKAGRLTELVNENQQNYAFEYDPVGKLTQETDFAGQVTIYKYGTDGRLTGTLNRPRATNLEFDRMGRVTRKSSVRANEDQSPRIPLTDYYSYDALGRLIQARNEHAQLNWTYDAAGRLTEETQTQNNQIYVWQHEYNALNTRIKTTRPDGSTIDWLTYGGGHVHGMLWNGEEVVSFERDQLHRETSRNQANSITQSKQYDAVGRLKSQIIEQAGQTQNQRHYDYDAAGQLPHISDQRRGELAYSYDPVGRLLQANSALGEELFAFDPAGNIESPPQDTNKGRAASNSPQTRANKVLDNLLKQFVGTHYTYDALGNMTERLHNGVKTTFEWDSNNRMSASETNGKRTTYAYDPLGRRISKTTDDVTTVYGWDGDTLAFEQTTDAIIHYIYEANSFVPLLQVVKHKTVKVLTTADGKEETQINEFEETVAYYHTDHLGTPQELTDGQGNVAWSANYKAWGEAKTAISKAAQAAGIDNKLRFQGQYLDEETGLHYNRHRYYDPHSGRFVSQDPIKLAGGNNLQVYAPNPTQWVDPLGLSCCNGDLDWSRVNHNGETAVEHVNLHGVDDLSKPSHGVFASDPVATTESAWAQAVRDGIQPTVGGNGNLIHDIPFPGAGNAGGALGNAAGNPVLNSVRIVTTPIENQVVTSFPR